MAVSKIRYYNALDYRDRSELPPQFLAQNPLQILLHPLFSRGNVFDRQGNPTQQWQELYPPINMELYKTYLQAIQSHLLNYPAFAIMTTKSKEKEVKEWIKSCGLPKADILLMHTLKDSPAPLTPTLLKQIQSGYYSDNDEITAVSEVFGALMRGAFLAFSGELLYTGLFKTFTQEVGCIPCLRYFIEMANSREDFGITINTNDDLTFPGSAYMRAFTVIRLKK